MVNTTSRGQINEKSGPMPHILAGIPTMSTCARIAHVDMVADFNELGLRVRDIRRAVGLTQEDLAAKIGIDRTAESRIESGNRRISAMDLSRIASALGVGVGDLVYRPVPGALAARRPLEEDSPETDKQYVRAEFELDRMWRDLQQLTQLGYLKRADVQICPDGLASGAEADDLARKARGVLELGTDPVGRIADVLAQFGLWIQATDLEVEGLSMSPEVGAGVALVGARLDPGRRRATAAHELGHHLSGDTYVASDHYVRQADAETLIQQFAAEFLLPTSVVTASGSPTRDLLIEISARYRVSWSLVINSCHRAGVDVSNVEETLVPTRDDFLRVIGEEPEPDLIGTGLSAAWVRACAQARSDGKVTLRRANEMARGMLAGESAQ